VEVPEEVPGVRDAGTGREPTGFQHPALRVGPTLHVYRPGSAELRRDPRLAGFVDRYSDAWEVRWDTRSDRPHLLQGAGIPLLPGRGNDLEPEAVGLQRGREPSLSDVERLLRELLRELEKLLGVQEKDLVLDLDRSVGFGPRQYFRSVEFRQVYRGVPVEARVFFRINHGNVVQLGTSKIADVQLDPAPRWSREQVTRAVLERFGLATLEVDWRDRGTLEILPVRGSGEVAGERFAGTPGRGYGHVLVWKLTYLSRRDEHSYRVLVNAASGEILEHLDLTDFSDATVTGQVFPQTNTQDLVSVPFGWATVANEGSSPVTDENGVYDYQGGVAGLDLDGRYARISDRCGGIELTSSTTGDLDLGGAPGGTDCQVPPSGGPGNTNAARTTWYHLTRINRTAAQYYPDNALLLGTLAANTNRLGTCNAFWNGASVNFYRAAVSSCANTGELAHVIYHEWGHAMDDHTGGNELERGSGEALADTFALIETREPCIGDNFRLGEPCHNCNPQCSGVRDLDAFGVGGIATVARPDTVEADTGLDCDRFVCPYLSGGLFPYQGPMGYEGHCESVIAGSANWDLAELLEDQYGPLGWERLEALWYGSLVPAQSAYRVAEGGLCNPQATVDGCAADNWYTVLLAVDDDDGDLSNGTPDGCRIYNAYAAHGIACGDPVPCSDGCQPYPLPDAGPDREICLGEATTIGTPALPGHSYSWEPGGATTAEVGVTPEVTTTYAVTATTACASYSDEVRVIVDDGSSDGLEEDFEGDTSAWTTTGLWHAVADSPCAVPGFASPVTAMYYGQDASCNYKTPGSNSGDLLSPQLFGIGPTSTLTFDYYRQVESGEGGYDRLQVQVAATGTTAWQTVWSRDSGDPSAAVWAHSGEISLAELAGETIRIRFHFDSVDGTFNDFTGILIDDVVVTASAACDLPPRVLIATPADGATLDNAAFFELSGSAIDEDGNLGDGLEWTSSRDGFLGTGSAVQTPLSLGSHQVSAAVEDSAGSLGSATVTVEVVDATPLVTVTSPADGSVFGDGDGIAFAGTAEDFEDGDLTAGLVWTSSLDGVVGSGGSFAAALSVGTHTVTAAATDGAGNVGLEELAVTVEPVPDLPPAVEITAPADGAVAAAGAPIAFSGTASDAEDGNLTASLSWTSDLDGPLGTGGSPSAALTTGVHVVTAAVTDGAGQTGGAAVTVVVTPTGAPPFETVLVSRAAEDGYVRESAEGSGAGGFANATGTGSRAIRIGDASGDRQYRSILSFDTSVLPDDAILLSARLRLRRGGLLGTDPFTILGACRVDVAGVPFGAGAALAASDFQAPATAPGAGVLSAAAADLEGSEADLDAAGRAAISRHGLTQLRLAFETPDDDDGAYDYAGYFSGETGDPASRPQLIVLWVDGP
jgi:hypothetical protein